MGMNKLHEKTLKQLVETYSDVIDINEDMDKTEALALVLDYELDHFTEQNPINPLLDETGDVQYTEHDFSEDET
jgi:hypothetical protein